MRFSVTTSDKAGAVNIQLDGHDQTFFIMSNIPTIETMSSEQILELKQKINLAHLLLSIAEIQIWGPFRINFAGKPSTRRRPVFTTEPEISKFAQAAVQNAVSAGIVGGYDGKLQPKAKATRAEISIMLLNLMKLEIRFAEIMNTK